MVIFIGYSKQMLLVWNLGISQLAVTVYLSFQVAIKICCLNNIILKETYFH